MLRFVELFSFGSKAETLQRLHGRLTQSSIPDFLVLTVPDWRADPDAILAKIAETMPADGDVIVRSSATNEDGELFAQAGAFLSVPHINPRKPADVRAAIDDVIASYGRDSEAPRDEAGDQVLVQAMVRDVSMSGVLFTQDLNTGAPYYVVNYDDESGSTDTITAGTGYANRTLYIYRDYWDQTGSRRFLQLLKAVREIEELTEDGCLDIEFALDLEHTVHILQVRRITTQPNWNRGLGVRIGDSLTRLGTTLAPRLLHGERRVDGGTVLGKMPDWNPAEMIGNAPRRLAFSLYRHLITDSSWRRARVMMGYREPRGLPLMRSCAGQPFIDVRQSFRSYLPADLPAPLCERIVDHWLSHLSSEPHLHDKVEFAVAITTLSFDYEARSARLLPGDLTDSQRRTIREAFRRLTVALVEGRRASIGEQIAAVEELQRRHAAIVGNGALSPSVELVSELLEDAIQFGTVPFSILARHAFIARTLLDSLVNESALSEKEVDRFAQSVPTVATDFLVDIERCAGGGITREALLDRYGHLRPGTYDILSWRYDQRGAAFLGAGSGDGGQHRHELPEFRLDRRQRHAIARLLKREGFSIDPQGLLDYCAAAIQGREWAKFVFTRSISDSLEAIAAWGHRLGLSRDELSYLDIRDILDCLVDAPGRSLEQHLRALAEKGRRDHEVTAAIRLPYLLARPSDLVVVPMQLQQPNFVTLKSISGPSILVTGRDVDPEALDGKIVAIESADPGFDWIFTRRIGGLVTKFGGANSHMAIRCAEFDLPAAIGCGEQIFERVVRSEYVELDCAVGRIEPVRH